MKIAGSKQSVLTLASLLQSIKAADVVYTQIRFGTVETWVKISKKEALGLWERLGESESLAGDWIFPEDFGLDKFGSLEVDAITMEKVLYLG
jgi:hypothetical protein